jgi:hypothetical protein
MSPAAGEGKKRACIELVLGDRFSGYDSEEGKIVLASEGEDQVVRSY